MRRLLLFGGLVAASLRALTGAAQTLDPTFVAPTSLYATGDVSVLGPAQADGKRLVGTAATRVNNTAVSSRLLRLDATGALDLPFLQNVGAATEPYRIRGLANGQYLLVVQGTTVTAGGLTRPELLRLNADGTADASFDAGTGSGDATNFGYLEDVVQQADGKLVVSGEFNVFSGQTAHSVVRLNASGSVDGSFNVGSGPLGTGYADVATLAVQADGRILAGGVFSSFSGQPAAALVRLTADGALDPTFSSALASNDYVYNVLVQPDGKIVVNGLLTQNGVRTSMVRLLPSGSFDPGFTLSTALGATVGTSYQEPPVALQPDGKLVVVGSFDLPGYRHVARLNADGSLDLAFQTPEGLNNRPATLGLQPGGGILVGGNFTGVGNTETSLARLTSAGLVDAAYAPKLQNLSSVEALVRQADGSLLAAGSFTEWDGVAVHRVVRLSATGTLDATYAAAGSPLTGSASLLLLQADGKAVVGTYNNLYRLLPGGALDAGFAQFAPNSVVVTALGQQADGKLLVGGLTSGFGGGSAYARLVRLNANGGFDGTFTAPVSAVGNIGSPTALLVQQDGRILLAANSTASGLTLTAYVQRYEANGATDASWSVPSFSNGTLQARVSTLVQQPDGQVLAGGRFNRVGSSSAAQHNVVRFGPTGSVDTSFAPGSLLNTNGTGVLALAVQPNGRVLVGGSFNTVGTYTNLLRLSANGVVDPTFSNAASPNGPVRTILVQPDGGILLQGGFLTIGGQARRNLARITAPNVLAVAAPAAVAAATTAWPVPAHEVLRVLPAPTAHPRHAELLDALGRVVQQQQLSGPAEFSFDTGALPAGLYVLRLRYAEGTVSRQVAVE